LRFIDKNADLISLGATIFGAITTPLNTLISSTHDSRHRHRRRSYYIYLDTLDGTCSLGLVVLYATTGIIALSFFVDGSIRGATEKKC
jgi:hypothetical protein